jgi:signal transduction histidine kinase
LRVRIANVLAIKIARDLLQDELKIQSTDIQALIAEVASRSAALQVALSIAERASQTKSAFLSLVSHELCSPLTVLRLTADWQRRRAALATATLDPSVRRTDEALARLEGIVETVIELVKLQAGPAELHFERIDVEALIREVTVRFASQAAAKGLALRVDVARDARTVTSDPRLLGLILSNLLGNAIKFTEVGEVVVSTYPCDGTVLAVRDSGRGIEAQDRVRILQPFRHLETITHKSTPGMGLGLALVRELVATLGGTLALTSEPGTGSLFSVTLPDRIRTISPAGPERGGLHP